MKFATLFSLYSIALSIPTSEVNAEVAAAVERSVSSPSGPVKLCFLCGSDCGGSCGCGGCGGCSGSTDTGCSSSGCSSSSSSGCSGSGCSSSSDSGSTTCATGDCTGDGPVIIGSHGPGMRAWSQAAARWRAQRQTEVQRYAQQHASQLVGQHVAMHAVHFLNNLHF